MSATAVPSGRPSAGPRTSRTGPVGDSLALVYERLAKAEHELRIQFTRIAQLQAQLDVIVGALQRQLPIVQTLVRAGVITGAIKGELGARSGDSGSR
jgi:hypothetical protein